MLDEHLIVIVGIDVVRWIATDAAGKFQEALDKLIAGVSSGHSKFSGTTGVDEFRRLHAEGHYPALGYDKKLSMRHHVEALAQYHAS